MAAEALKLDTSEVGGDNGIPSLVGGVLPSSDVDWANNAEAIAGTSDVKVMSPLRTNEHIVYVMSAMTGLLSVTTGVSQANTINIAPSKLTYFDTTDADVNSHSESIAMNQEIQINTDAKYKIFGNMSVEASNGDIVSMQLYKNGSPVDGVMSVTGRGVGKPVSLSYNAVLSLIDTDLLTIYAHSDANNTDITITSSYVGVEKTVYQ